MISYFKDLSFIPKVSVFKKGTFQKQLWIPLFLTNFRESDLFNCFYTKDNIVMIFLNKGCELLRLFTEQKFNLFDTIFSKLKFFKYEILLIQASNQARL